MIREAVDRVHHQIIYPRLTIREAQTDREVAHERALDLMESWFEDKPLLLALMGRSFTFEDPRLNVKAFDTFFDNPIGVAAGFDKNARVFNTLGALGFGHIEVGSVTTVPYEGNKRPRVFASPEDNALVNRMGFPGDGLETFRDRVIKGTRYHHFRNYRIGINIGASRPSFERGTAIADIVTAHDQLSSYGDYTVDNISSPNTQGVRGLQDPAVLEELLSATDSFHTRQNVRGVRGVWKVVTHPRLIKLAPDLDFQQVSNILDVALRHNVDGVIVTNTTINPEVKAKLQESVKAEQGGVSGAPLTDLALAMSRFVYQETSGKLPIVRAGGIMSGRDAWEAITWGGASLVQVYTAFVNERTSTPNLAYYLNQELVKRLERERTSSLNEVRGQAPSRTSLGLLPPGYA